MIRVSGVEIATIKMMSSLEAVTSIEGTAEFQKNGSWYLQQQGQLVIQSCYLH